LEKKLTPFIEQSPQSGAMTSATLTHCWFTHICHTTRPQYQILL